MLIAASSAPAPHRGSWHEPGHDLGAEYFQRQAWPLMLAVPVAVSILEKTYRGGRRAAMPLACMSWLSSGSGVGDAPSQLTHNGRWLGSLFAS